MIMTTPLPGTPEQQRVRGKSSQTWEERFPRYARNADVTAGIANGYAAAMRRAAGLHRVAAVNASRHGDREGAGLYDEMAKAALDAADALADITRIARRTARHYAGKPEQEKRSYWTPDGKRSTGMRMDHPDA
jgi:hypothetical protein